MNIKYKLVISLKPITGLHNQIRNLEAIHVLNVYGPAGGIRSTCVFVKGALKSVTVARGGVKSNASFLSVWL